MVDDNEAKYEEAKKPFDDCDPDEADHDEVDHGVELDTDIRKINEDDLKQEEARIRTAASSGLTSYLVGASAVNMFSAILVLVFHLLTFEAVASMALSVGLTVYTYRIAVENDEIDGATMTWTLLAFAVITPLSASITMAFTRREQALDHLAVVKSTILNLFSAHTCWDWCAAGKPNSGRAGSSRDWLKHADTFLDASLAMLDELTRMLTLPSGTRARHRVMSMYRQESEEIDKLIQDFHRSIVGRVAIISSLCEDLKREGLPPNEGIRIRQWEQMLGYRIERLLVTKCYRTPQALRSFARLFTVFLPPFYAPYFGQMAKDLNSLGMAIAFSMLTSIALTALFESITQMEDPFVGYMSLDGILVRQELEDYLRDQLLDCRSRCFPGAKEFQEKERGGALQKDTTLRVESSWWI